MPSITITTSASEGQRLLSAFRVMTGNPSATEADVKEYVVKGLRRIVIDHERQQQIAAISTNSFEPT